MCSDSLAPAREQPHDLSASAAVRSLTYFGVASTRSSTLAFASFGDRSSIRVVHPHLSHWSCSFVCTSVSREQLELEAKIGASLGRPSLLVSRVGIPATVGIPLLPRLRAES